MKTSILDQFVRSSGAFRPRSVEEVFALRLARKLEDEPAASHYARLAGEHSIPCLLSAYRHALRTGHAGDLGRRFHEVLQRLSGDQPTPRSSCLLALRIERRSIAAAVFLGNHLDFTDIRQLSSRKEKAFGSAIRFVNWLFDNFKIDSAAVETIRNAESQRRSLSDLVETTLQDRLLSIYRIPKSEVFEAFGRPRLRSRRELREVTTGIWPILAGTGAKVFVRDAAALGLHVQTERLFIT